MNKLLIKKEYDKNTREELGKKRFTELCRFAEDFNKRNKGKESFEPFKFGYNSVTPNGYVGVIQLSDGFQIEILPKIFNISNDKKIEIGQKLLIAMLQKTKMFHGIDMKNASLKSGNINICELFIYNYIQEIKRLVRRGIKSNYTAQEDNLSVFKGKLMVSEHIRRNVCHKERFYVAFDEYNQNIPENRIIKSTLTKLSRLTSNTNNANEIKRLLTDFADIDLSWNYKKDFAGITINRNNKDYDTIIQLSRMFLDGESATMSHGRVTAWSFLLPMWELYEKYVAYYVKKIFEEKILEEDCWTVKTQDDSKYLFDKPEKFELRPDIVLEKPGRTVILDTKWKEKDTPDNQDMYQMLAYACRYNTKEIYLLYPATGTDNLTTAEYKNEHMNLRVCFINLYNLNDENSSENTPDSSITQSIGKLLEEIEPDRRK